MEPMGSYNPTATLTSGLNGSTGPHVESPNRETQKELHP